MRVLLDGRFIGVAGGIGRYSEELLRALLTQQNAPEFFVLATPAGAACLADIATQVHIVPCSIPWYSVAEQVQLPALVRSVHADLIHWTHWNVPVRSPRPFVLTVHDLIQLRYPSARATTHGAIAYAIKRVGFRFVLSQAVRHASTILVPTPFVAQDLTRQFPVCRDRVVVTGEGYSAKLTVTQDASAVRMQMGITGRYLLAVGNAYPHKNHALFLTAFGELRKEFVDLTLVIAGHQDAFFARLQREVSSHAQVRCIPDPTDAQLAALYAGATAFVHPAFEEGFGLPPLEALHAGIPVVSSNGGSLPDVLQNAAQYFSPSSVAECVHALREVLTKDSVVTTLRAAAPAVMAQWTWDRTAAMTLAAYSRLS